ncbi:hypothetical protein BGZ70_007098 [Mortierella alpina]|uniref:F-box domain-containing protein n=1 Tax=Mortierella alpina TaxID=64518 RepID=A0A9P6J795_MORAP|nr:hypothetical protein BGZ70_007098 [Mortierella alpina]
MSKRAAIQVFEIPELAIKVLVPLERSDLVACALVHRAWHDAVIPFLYHTVTTDEIHHNVRSPDEFCWDGFQKHSAHMRVLKIDNRAEHDLFHYGLHCTLLTDFHLDISEKTSQSAPWSWDLLRLICNNAGLSTLCLTTDRDSRVNEMDSHLVVLRLLRHMPGLKKLIVVGTSMGESSVDEIMRCAYRLEELVVTMDRIDKEPNLRSSKPHHLDVNLALHLADLASNNPDDDADTQGGPCILDSQGRRCRQGTRLKRFSLTLKNGRKRGVLLADASPLVRLCCSAEYIQLCISDVMEGPSRRNSFLTLHELVARPTCRLKHLDIGPTCPEDYSVLVRILSDSACSLVSFRLWESYFTDELLSVLLQNHGKTLQRVAVGKCPEFFFKSNIEALLSGCPDLEALDLYNCDRGGDRRMAMTGGPKTQWVGSDERVFKVFVSRLSHWTFIDDGRSVGPVYVVSDAACTGQNDLWKHLESMRDSKFNSHIRFSAEDHC